MACSRTSRSAPRRLSSSARVSRPAAFRGRIPRPEQAFVGINVSYPGQQLLIQQRGLDSRAGAPEQTGELRRPDGERLRARPGKSLGAHEVPEFQPPNRRGSTKRSSRPLASPRRACVWRAAGASGAVTSKRPVIPRCTIHCAAGGAVPASAAEAPAALNSHTICLPVRWTATITRFISPRPWRREQDL